MQSRRKFRHLFLPLLLAASAVTAPALAQISIHINVGPPPMQYEAVPVMAPGYAWAPGYWAWNGDRHVWVRGRVMLERVGYRWAPDRWEQREHAYYRYPGRWEPDPGYRYVKLKKEKKPKKSKHRDDDDDDHDRHDRGHGNKHDKGR